MKVVLLAENLQKKLFFANKAISSKNQLPILSQVLLVAQGDSFTVSSTDLEIGIETSLQVIVEQEGAITVPARLFLELANSLPHEKITLETKETFLEITSSKTHTTLQTTPKEEFPILYTEKGKEVLIFKEGGMKTTFGKILFAASSESTRPALSGILLQKKQNSFICVATDGYRLSYDEIPTGEKGDIQSLLIPARFLKEAVGLFEGGNVSLFLSEKNNQIILEQEGTILIGRTIDAQFPNYEKVIPTDSATKMTLDREELFNSVKTCAIFARDASNIITFTIRKEGLIVAAKNPAYGENTVAVDAAVVGEENAIAFNARYLLEALTNITESDLSFSMTGPLNPGVFQIPGNKHFLHLIMPIRT